MPSSYPLARRFLQNWGTPPTNVPFVPISDKSGHGSAKDVILGTRGINAVPEGFGRGKIGLKERVEAIIEEHCDVDEYGVLKWK